MKLRDLFRFPAKNEIGEVFSTGKERDELFDDIEEKLILSDIPVPVVHRIIETARKTLKTPFTKDEFLSVLRKEIADILNGVYIERARSGTILPLSEMKIEMTENSQGKNRKKVVFLVGVNGSGKTTSAAKLAWRMMNRGEKVLLCASDTFRAAGSSQLVKWGEKLGIPVIGGEQGADPGSVLFNGMNALMNRDHSMMIVDTAGRVQTKENLMRELDKLTKIVKKFIPGGPSEVLLVIDATMGQNTLDQARKFREFSGITGIMLTKLDGTAKGGAVLNIIMETGIPVIYVGTGEIENDIGDFSVEEFAASFTGD